MFQNFIWTRLRKSSRFRPEGLLPGMDKGHKIKPPKCPLKSRMLYARCHSRPKNDNQKLPLELPFSWLLSLPAEVGGGRINVVLKVI